MKLLIVTQVVDRNDPVLGFFHRWIEEFAQRVDSVEVICLFEGAHDLPENVRVHSLGKERGRRGRLTYALRFLRLAWSLRSSYDVVFVHMNQEYVLVGGWLWRLLRKRVMLWYTHGSVSWKLRFAIPFAHRIFTASQESLRITTKKKRVMGHGIDTAKIPFSPAPESERIALLTAGRLSPVKRVELIIKAVGLLKQRGYEVTLTVAGGGNFDYVESLRKLTADLGLVQDIRFLGPIPQPRIFDLYGGTHIFVHASKTGSLDKAAIEPLAAGVLLVTTNTELSNEGIGAIRYAQPTAETIAEQIIAIEKAKAWRESSIREEGRAYIQVSHELTKLIARLLADMTIIPHRRSYE